MEIVDKEQERLAKEQTPEGRKKRALKWVGNLAVFVAIAIVYQVLMHYHVFSGEPYPVSLENITIVPGQTTVQELLEAGYELSDREYSEVRKDTGMMYYTGVIDPSEEADAKTYYMMVLVKEGRAHASITVYNWEEWSKKPLGDCKVSMVDLRDFHEKSEQAAILDIPILEATKEAISERLGKEPEVLESGRYRWEKGKYSLMFETDENATLGKGVRSEYKLN